MKIFNFNLIGMMFFSILFTNVINSRAIANDIVIDLKIGEAWNHVHQTPRGGQINFQVRCEMNGNPNPNPIPPQDIYYCAYNYSDYNWGIFTAKAPAQADAKNEVLDQCSRHNNQNCSADFVRCEKETFDNTYVSCTYEHGSYGTFFGEGETNLEAKTNALILCENKNKADCNEEFVTCRVLSR